MESECLPLSLILERNKRNGRAHLAVEKEGRRDNIVQSSEREKESEKKIVISRTSKSIHCRVIPFLLTLLISEQSRVQSNAAQSNSLDQMFLRDH